MFRAGVLGGVGVGIIVDYTNCYCELSPNSYGGIFWCEILLFDDSASAIR